MSCIHFPEVRDGFICLELELQLEGVDCSTAVPDE